MADVASKRVNIYIDQTAAETALVKLQTQADKLNKSIAAGQTAGKNMVASLKQLDGVNTSIKKVQDQIDKGLKPSIQQQTTLVTQLRNELKRLSESDPQFTAKLKNFQAQNAELQKMQANITGVTKSNEDLGSSFSRVLTRVAEYASIYVVFDKIKSFLVNSVEEASHSEQALTKLKGILDNIGRSDAFERIKISAESMTKRFQYLDTPDVVDVFQKLITYGKLTEAQINELLPVIINFSAKSQTSLEESTGIVIKALEGNSRALKEYGINMKDGANVTERMSILMRDLKPRVDGAADAFGQTFAGQLAISKQKMKDLEEEAGNKLIPILTKLLNLANTVLDKVNDLGTFISTPNFSGGASIFAQKQADQFAKQNDAAVNSLLGRTEGADTATKQKYLDDLDKKIALLETQYRDALFSGTKAQIGQFNTAIFIYTKARAQLADQLKSEQGGVLGLGDDAKPNTKALEEAAKKLAELKKQAEAFYQQLKHDSLPAVLQPYDDALKKFTEGIAQAQEYLSKGATSPDKFKEDVKNLTDQYNKTVNQLNSERDAITPIHVPIEISQPDVDKEIKNLDDIIKKRDEAKKAKEKADAEAEKKAIENRNKIVDETLKGFDVLFNALSELNAQQERFDQRRLDAIEQSNNAEKAKYAQLVASKEISNQTYQQKSAQLDQQLADKREELQKKEFERTKRLQIAQTIINGAAAIIKAAPNVPLEIATAIETAIQLGVIAAQRYAQGGKVLSGEKINSNQNIPTQKNGDNVLAYVKRGEVVLNEKQQAALGGPSTFANIGVPGFAPGYKTRPYMAIDTTGITQNYSRLKFAAGGLVGAYPESNLTRTDPETKELLASIFLQLQKPVPAVVDVVNIQLKQITDAQATLTRIKQNATLQ